MILREELETDFVVEDIERSIGHMKKLPGLKANTMSSVRVNKARNLLRKILDRAVKNGWPRDNPVLEAARLREDPAEIDPMSWTEVGLLLDKGFPNEPEMRRFYTVEIFTGLRTSELLGLKWVNVGLDRRHSHGGDQHSFTKLDGEHLTKTPGSARAVDLRPQAVRAIKEVQAASRLKSEYVFCNAVGGPLDRDNLMNRVWYPALKRAGIRERRAYQSRHTFATLALAPARRSGGSLGNLATPTPRWSSVITTGGSGTTRARTAQRSTRRRPSSGCEGLNPTDSPCARSSTCPRPTAETRQNGRQKSKGPTGRRPRKPSIDNWSGRPDSNRRRPAWEAGILPLNYARLEDYGM